MATKLVIAEKEALARAIASAIPGPETSSGNPIIKGDYMITWLSGHVLALREPEDYDENYKTWNMEDLPFYFKDWEHKPKPGKENMLEKVGELLEEAEIVIHAGDPDDEGQYLVDEVLHWFHFAGPVYRLNTGDMTPSALQRELGNMRDNRDAECMGYAAYARTISDLMVGINLSRCYTLLNGRTLHVGRVQSPTLGMVVNRDMLIENHVKQKFYTMNGILNVNGVDLEYNVELDKEDPRLTDGKLTDKSVAETIAAGLQGKEFDNISISSAKSTENPPLPFNLEKLQTYCGNTFGYEPSEVLDITQKLRMDYSAITYNRSDCEYLSDDQYKEAPATIQVMCQNIRFTPAGMDTSIKSKAFNQKKIAEYAHTAIIPSQTAVNPADMPEKLRNVYLAICKYYLAQFLPPAEKVKTSMSVPAGDFGKLTAHSTVIVSPGYRSIFKEIKETPPTELSNFADGVYRGRVTSSEYKEKETAPPARYTKTSLNTDMTRIAKYVEDPEVKELLIQKDADKKGENGSIGTPATRASTIDKLVDNGYVEMNGRKLKSTALGRELYRVLPDDLRKPNMTAYWWATQEKIKSGELDYEALPLSVLESIKQIMSSDIPLVNKSILPPAPGTEVIGKCPMCGGDIIAGKYAYGCKQWGEGCKFVLYKTSKKGLLQDVTITKQMAAALIQGKEVRTNKLTSSKGTHFEANIKLEIQPDADYPVRIKMVFDSEKPIEERSIGKCPRCNGHVIETKSGYVCEKRSEGCKFAIWKSAKSGIFKDVTISAIAAKKLLSGGKVKSSKLYSAKKDKNFTGEFQMDDSQRSEYGARLKLVF